MKIDTKHCTPIKSGSAPEGALLNPNDFILPGNQEQHACEGSISTTTESTEENIKGREQKYLLQLVYTSVLTSVRQPRTPESNTNGDPRRRLLDYDQMNKLNKHFEALLTLDPDKEMLDDPKNNALTDEDESESTGDEDGKPPALGRIVGMTNSGAPVSRSARLADKDQQAEE